MPSVQPVVENGVPVLPNLTNKFPHSNETTSSSSMSDHSYDSSNHESSSCHQHRSSDNVKTSNSSADDVQNSHSDHQQEMHFSSQPAQSGESNDQTHKSNDQNDTKPSSKNLESSVNNVTDPDNVKLSTLESSTVPEDQKDVAAISPVNLEASSNEESNSQLPSEVEKVDSNEKIVNDKSTMVDDPTVVLDDDRSNETISKVGQCDVNSEFTNSDVLQTELDNAQSNKPKYRVDAEEFVPRAYRQNYENPVPVPNFIPLPIIGDIYAPNFPNPAFLPPINFIPNVPNFLPNQFFMNQEQFYVNSQHVNNSTEIEYVQPEEKDAPNDNKNNETVLNSQAKQNPPDIATVNKLEGVKENAKEVVQLHSPARNFRKNNQKTENKSSPRKLNERGQNGHNRMPKRLPQVKTEPEVKKDCPKIDNKVEAPKEQPIKAEIITKTEAVQVEISTNTNVIPNGLPKAEKIIEKQEATFSKMLKTSVSLIENRTEPKPSYRKQNSYNGVRTTHNLREANTKNYSETVKKQFKQPDGCVCSRFDRNRKVPETEIKKSPKIDEPVKNVEKSENKTMPINSWISVSSRKKRKNKNAVITNEMDDLQDNLKEINGVEQGDNCTDEISIEESVAEIEKTYEKQQKEQEKTINLVVVQSEESKVEELKVEEKTEVKIEEVLPKPVLTTVNKNEKKNKKSDKSKAKVSKNNKRIIINDKELKINQNVEQVKNVVQNSPNVIIESDNPKSPTVTEVITHDQEVEKEEVKVTEEVEVETVSLIETVPVVSETSNNETEIIQEKEINVVQEKEINEVVEEVKEEPKSETSKSKKKKKKSKAKPQNLSTTTSVDETYDFLVEDSFSNPDSKTNIEVSQELDRMIQRGLYANIEEKLKTYNPTDSFIQSVSPDNFSFNLGNSFEGGVFKSMDKLKNFDFSGVLFNTTMNKTFEKVMLNKNENKIDAGFKKNLNSNSSTDHFLGETKNKDDNLSSSKNFSDINDLEIDTEILSEPVNGVTNGQHLQITKAVKEWMNKTRENTPEVEILKSVNEIRNEYLICHDLSDSDDEIDDEMPKNVEGLPVRAKSAKNESDDCKRTRESHEKSPDLLDCWESDIEIKNFDNKLIDVRKRQISNGHVQNGNVPEKQICVDKGEDVLEVYESVYGKNEDFLRIQKEVEEKKREKKGLTYPRDGGLPYRAICCSVM